MGNASASALVGKEKVLLKFTSRKELTFLDVLHVPDTRRNLISGPVLSNKGFKLVFEYNKVVLTKVEMFVGKGYLANGAMPSHGGKHYYVTFIDDCRKYCCVYLLHSKDETLDMFKTYKVEVENQLNNKIKVLRSDRGGEIHYLC
ncbi:unnamed protein product [Prunus armeniaca]